MSLDASAAPDLTVIIIGHQVKDEVLDCLASLEAHRGDLRLQVVYVDNGDLRGSGSATISGGATGGGATYDISGTWAADDSGGICTRLNLGRLTLPPRCQYWYRYGGQYFLADSAEDRSAQVLRRTVKQ